VAVGDDEARRSHSGADPGSDDHVPIEPRAALLRPPPHPPRFKLSSAENVAEESVAAEREFADLRPMIRKADLEIGLPELFDHCPPSRSRKPGCFGDRPHNLIANRSRDQER